MFKQDDSFFESDFLTFVLLQVNLLTLAVDSLTTVDDFLAVSEAHIIEDVKTGIQVPSSIASF